MPNTMAEAEAFYTEGKTEEAENRFRSLLHDDPRNKQALNNLGVIAAGKNEYGRALEYLSRALEIDPHYLEAIVNFCELLRATGNLHRGRALLEMAAVEYPDDETIAGLLTEARRAGQAAAIVNAPPPSKTIPAGPTEDSNETVEPKPETPEIVLPDKLNAKVAVLALPGMDSFLRDIIDFLQPRCEVKTCFSGTGEEIQAVVEWADVVWVEWANELAVMLTKALPEGFGKRIICRLHSYEAFAGFIPEIVWERIDDLVFVAEHIKEHVLARVPDLAERVGQIHVIPNGVDLDKYPFNMRQKGKNLAYLGYINYKKGPMLLLHALAELVGRDDEYCLYMAGKFQDDRDALYYNQMVKELGLENNIRFDGWVDDVAGWLADKQYIISTSLLESQGMGIMQGMACGLKPVIHNFVGARGIYGDKYVWNGIGEFVDRIMEDDFDSAEYRAYIEKNYAHNQQMRRLADLIRPVEKSGPESHCGAGSNVVNTAEIRRFLGSVLKRYKIESMIDVPCGDWNWMRLVDLTDIAYTGYDNDEGFINDNRERYPDHNFEVADALAIGWPKADLILCRDFTIHLPNDDIVRLLDGFKKSGAKYLITTSYDYLTENTDFTEAQNKQAYGRHARPSRIVNLEIDPYRLGPPLESVRENSSVACQNRIVGLWKLN